MKIKITDRKTGDKKIREGTKLRDRWDWAKGNNTVKAYRAAGGTLSSLKRFQDRGYLELIAK